MTADALPTLDEALKERRELRRKMRGASPAVRDICEKPDRSYGELIKLLR